jgi:hypothetical protein
VQPHHHNHTSARSHRALTHTNANARIDAQARPFECALRKRFEFTCAFVRLPSHSHVRSVSHCTRAFVLTPFLCSVKQGCCSYARASWPILAVRHTPQVKRARFLGHTKSAYHYYKSLLARSRKQITQTFTHAPIFGHTVPHLCCSDCRPPQVHLGTQVIQL